MTRVTLPQAQAIAVKQYEAKKRRLNGHIARRADWITVRASMIMRNGADQQEMKLLEGGI